MKQFDLGWFVGMVDGEGCISINKSKCKKRKVKKPRIKYGSLGFILTPRISITSTDVNAINKIKNIVKQWGITYYCKKRRRNSNDGCLRVECWDFQIHRIDEVKLVLEKIKKYLVIKNKQGNLVHKYCCSRINILKKVKRNADAHYSSKELNIYEQIKVLNMRGIRI